MRHPILLKTFTSHLFQPIRFYLPKNLPLHTSPASFSTSAILKNPSQPLIKQLRIGVQGAPLDRGQPKPGVEKGPQVVRNAGLIDILKELGHDVVDYGDVPIDLPPRCKAQQVADDPSSSENCNLRNLKAVAEATRLISNGSSKIVKDKRICVTIGGDHSTAIGSVNGVSEIHNDLAVLWIDAHSDINTHLTTTSGNIHGMSVAFFLKELQPPMSNIPEFSWVTPRVSASNLAYIGLRSVDPEEKKILQAHGIAAYNMRDVDRLGIWETVRLALEKICPGFQRPLHLSFDIDALDDLEVSNTGTPVSGGLTLREGMVIVEEVYNAGNMVSMDLVEINPDLGNKEAERRTGRIAQQLIANAFGYNYSTIQKQQQMRQ